jgi:UDP-3-O-acyl-N-acetylglucosamine deacetylase
MFGGQEAKVLFQPADADTGIVFVRKDTPEPVRIEATVRNVADHSRRTAIKKAIQASKL